MTAAPKPVEVLTPKTNSKERHAPMYRVLIHNDDRTTMGFVVQILVSIFALQHEKAVQIMLEAHDTQVALVTVETLERAEFHVDQCRSLARAAKFPLSLSIESEE